jgi:hypothetical protein
MTQKYVVRYIDGKSFCIDIGNGFFRETKNWNDATHLDESEFPEWECPAFEFVNISDLEGGDL